MAQVKKPTAAQRKVLEAMRDSTISHWPGLVPTANIEGGSGVHMNTFMALQDRGWIAEDKAATAARPSLVHVYTLTDLGRAAIRKE